MRRKSNSPKVDTGDYVCPSIEHIVTIDRKDSTSELLQLYINFKRFTKELERMKSIEFVICMLFSLLLLQEFPKILLYHPIDGSYLGACSLYEKKS
jgi:hypothetical protein